MSSHTPGPWTVDGPFGEQTWIVTHGDGGTLIAEVYTAANAALVAVAPELIEAAQDYLREMDYLAATDMHDNYTDRARARAREADALVRLRTAVARVEGWQL